MAEATVHTHTSIWSKIIKKKKWVDWNGNETKLYHYLIFFSIVYKEGWINLIHNDTIVKVCFILCIIKESSITQINMNIKFFGFLYVINRFFAIKWNCCKTRKYSHLCLFFFTQQLILTNWIILSIILFNIWNKKSAF